MSRARATAGTARPMGCHLVGCGTEFRTKLKDGPGTCQSGGVLPILTGRTSGRKLRTGQVSELNSVFRTSGSAVTRSSAELLAILGLSEAALPAPPASPGRFPDGAHYRIEIPSVDGPRCLD